MSPPADAPARLKAWAKSTRADVKMRMSARKTARLSYANQVIGLIEFGQPNKMDITMSVRSTNRRVSHLAKPLPTSGNVTHSASITKDGRNHETVAVSRRNKCGRRPSRGETSLKTPSLFDELRKIQDHRDGKKRGRQNQFYTDQALLMRESLSFDVAILAKLDKLYKRIDSHNSGEITQDEYTCLSRNIYQYIKHQWDPDLPELSCLAATQLAEEEWQQISPGIDTLDRPRFTNAMFELCDTWTENIDAKEYMEFLQSLENGLWRVLESGECVYRYWLPEEEKRLGEGKPNDEISEHCILLINTLLHISLTIITILMENFKK